MRMPPTTRVYRFDEDGPGTPEQGPATLGAWIRDVPDGVDPLSEGGGGTYVWISEEHHLLFFSTALERFTFAISQRDNG